MLKNLFQIELAVVKVIKPSKLSLYYWIYKNGQYSIMTISLTIRDRGIFDILLQRAQKTQYKCNKKSFLAKCPLSPLTL
jgi:hypothetical protein